MTDIQVKYWANKESARHNREMEKQNLLSIEEIERSNRAREQISALQANAAIRTAEANIAKANADIAHTSAQTAYTQAMTANTQQRTETEKHKTTSASVDADYAQATSWITTASKSTSMLGGWLDLVAKGVGLIDRIFD